MSSFQPKLLARPNDFNIVLSGISPSAALLTEQLLLKNDKEFHCFFNSRKFHNHLVHQLLAAYSVGASRERLQEIFDEHASYLKPVPSLIDTITRDNYKNYLNNADAYSSYLVFFQSEIKAHGMIETIRRWVWSGDFLSRTFGGVFHPLIHLGYALEYNLPGVAAEGLSMAACTDNYLNAFTPIQPDIPAVLMPIKAQTYIEEATASTHDFITHLAEQLSSRLPTSFSAKDKENSEGNRRSLDDETLLLKDIPDYLKQNQLIKILLQAKNDKAFDNLFTFDTPNKFRTITSNKKASSRIRHYSDMWSVEENSNHIQQKYKELFTVALLCVGAGGVRKDHPGEFKIDFFLLHAFTSASFLHHFLTHITPSEAVLLLKAHFSSLLLYYITQGRPDLYIDGLLKYRPKSESPTPSNEWLGVYDQAIHCKEAHRIKLVRGCALGQILYGSHDNEQLNLAWLKVAQMAVDESQDWNFSGVGFDETWKE